MMAGDLDTVKLRFVEALRIAWWPYSRRRLAGLPTNSSTPTGVFRNEWQPWSDGRRKSSLNRVARAAFVVSWRHLADLKRGRSEPKRPLAAHRESIAIAVRDREAPSSNPGRVVRTFRQECLDHVVVFNERHLLALLTEFVHYYNHDRPHRTIEPETPVPSPQISHGDVVSPTDPGRPSPQSMRGRHERCTYAGLQPLSRLQVRRSAACGRRIRRRAQTRARGTRRSTPPL